MGLFLEMVIIQHCKERTVKTAFKKFEKTENSYALSASECRYKKYDKGMLVLLNENCNGYDKLTDALSEELNKPVMLLYIYDEDFWGYYFYENGKEVDCFSPMPDYFGEAVSEEEVNRFAGKKAVIAEYFGINEREIEGYLVTRTEELEEEIYDSNIKAYADDEYGICECWQVTDFMRKVGYPYAW